MSILILQSSATIPLEFLMVLSSDGVTGATGLSPTVTISKNGAAFAAPSGAVSEIGSGWYKVAPNATDSNTLGPLKIHATAATAQPCDDKSYRVVAFNPDDPTRLGLTALPNAAAGAAGGLDTGTIIASGTAQAGAAGSITLAAGDVGTVGQYVGMLLYTTGGTGAGQLRTIAAYNAATKVANLAAGRTFAPAPDATTTYLVLRNAQPALNDSLQVVASQVAGNVTGSVGSVTGAVGSVAAAVTTDVSGTVATNLNATVSSRATPAQILATPGQPIATDVSGNVTVGTIAAAALTALAAAVWNALTSGMTTASSIGILLKSFVFTGANVNANAQVVADKTGYTAATVQDKTGYSLATAPPTTAQIIAAFQAQTLTVHPTAGTWDHAMTLVWALTRGKRIVTSSTTEDVYSTDGTTKLLTITYQTGGTALTSSPTGSTAVDD